MLRVLCLWCLERPHLRFALFWRRIVRGDYSTCAPALFGGGCCRFLDWDLRSWLKTSCSPTTILLYVDRQRITPEICRFF
jgi:hypothetical protein